MPAQLMDGSRVAEELLTKVAARAAGFERKSGRKPSLAAVLVGSDPASLTYVRMKTTRCQQSGVESQTVRMPDETTTEQLVERIRALSSDPGVDGILLQHPVPAGIEERAAFEAIVPSKDVDGVTMHSFAAMAFGYPGFASCTPGGMVRLLDAYGVEPRGKHVVVVGRSAILGKPFGMLMLARSSGIPWQLTPNGL